jgi:exopolysaccharide biosynthesis protein
MDIIVKNFHKLSPFVANTIILPNYNIFIRHCVYMLNKSKRLRRGIMALQTKTTRYATLHKQKQKRRLFLRLFSIFCLVILLSGGGFLYGTNQGHQFRKMLVGTVLSTQHAQYVKYMQFLLSQLEIDALRNAMNHPKTVQTKIKKTSTKLKSQILQNTIKVESIDTLNYTAKIMIIPDPTTVHLVGTKFSNKGQALSDLIKDNNGVAGINAGGFYDQGGTGSGGQIIGIAISRGNVLSTPRSGKDSPLLVGGFLNNGQFITGKYSVNQLLKLGVTDAVSFGPQLIVNGKNCVTPSIDAAWGWAPRTAIGQTKDGSVVMIITDGRFYWNNTHRGATMSDMAHLFETYHTVNAIAMDGGGSTTMIKDGELLLKPATSTRVGMRYLPNGWVVVPPSMDNEVEP